MSNKNSLKEPVQTTIYDIIPKDKINEFKNIEILTIPTFNMEYRKEKNKFIEQVKNKFDLKNELKIRDALKFAEKIHKEQRRDTGEPYITHPLKVASYVMEAGFNAETVITALLHDVIEDGLVEPKELYEKFGKNVLKSIISLTKPKLHNDKWVFAESSKYFNIVDEYTKKEGKEKIDMYEERNNVYYPKIYESDSFIPIFVKIFDNIHNVETCDIHHSKKQLRTARIVATQSLLYMSKLLGFENEKMKKIIEILKKIIPDFKLEEHIGKIKHSKPVIKLPLRVEKSREMFLKMGLPEMENISLYGNVDQAYLMGFIEVGFPKKDIDYVKLLKEKMKVFDIQIYEGKSQLPTEIGASERIIVLKIGDPKIEKKGKKYRIIGTNFKVNLDYLEIADKNNAQYLRIKEIYDILYLNLKEIHKEIKNTSQTTSETE